MLIFILFCGQAGIEFGDLVVQFSSAFDVVDVCGFKFDPLPSSGELRILLAHIP